MSDRPLDLICLGRAAVDLYGEQLGSPLEAMSTFAMSLGGCAANVAVGTARLGLRVAMLTRVGDEHLGRFVRSALSKEGIDTTHVGTDPSRLTGLVVLGIRDVETFPLIFYRERCADMALAAEDFDRDFIQSSRAVLLTGTHFSTEQTDAVSRRAMALAKETSTKVVLDLDYRPVLWGLLGHGRGEDRYVESDRVSAHLLSIVKDCDLVVGTEEEINIAGGSRDVLTALRALRASSPATLVLKRGARGCVIFEGAIPESIDLGFVAEGLAIEVLNVLGAGDAFLSGFLFGWIRGEPLAQTAAYANACGALVVSRHSCSPAMPSARELEHYLLHQREIQRIDLDPTVNRLHRLAMRPKIDRDLVILAFDHRAQLEALAERHGAPRSRLVALKAIIAESVLAIAENTAKVADFAIGAIADDRLGKEALLRLTGRLVFLARPIEQPSATDLLFEGGRTVGLHLRTWPREHVVKCLVRYHPLAEKDQKTRLEEKLLFLQDATFTNGLELLLEVIPERNGAVDRGAIPSAVGQLYDVGLHPDWWKLPGLSTETDWRELGQIIERRDADCRGVLLLGLDAPEAELFTTFKSAAQLGFVRGFAVGRTIFSQPAGEWLAGQIDDAELGAKIRAGFSRVIDAWSRARQGTLA